ncbi:SPOR domain-containing protein [Sphingorhabdus arenilitoris]|uniref:SPOR domain-containing protein n=1 Tax=Sphingorhabdus arenilitoris TaxID=1490041 RepID=A0ABV8RI05_9SPHN
MMSSKTVGKPLGAKIGLAALAFAVAGTPALADVKAGVDAWTQGDYNGAVKEWREPALKGDADAQFNLGQAYKMGRGVPTDLNIALDWYRKAATQGHLQASDSYGHLLHYQGKIAESLPYLQASAARGEPRAQYLLGTELFNGVHIQKDWVRAYALMTRASSAGMAPASRSLAQMDQYIPLPDRQKGTVLAGELERQAGKIRAQQTAGFPINTAPVPPTGRPVDVPPSVASPSSEPGFPSSIPAAPSTGPVTSAPVAAAGVKKVPVAAPAPTPVAASGAWRIQLGAFSKESSATGLWTSLESRVSDLASLQPYLKAAGSVTRLQAGPFATRGAADAMCEKVKAAGQACIAVKN